MVPTQVAIILINQMGDFNAYTQAQSQILFYMHQWPMVPQMKKIHPATIEECTKMDWIPFLYSPYNNNASDSG